MGHDPYERLEALDLTLPTLPPPAFSYVPGVQTGNLVFVSGQTPTVDGVTMYQGRLGETFDVDEGIEAARLAALNVLAELHEVAGLDRVERIVRMTGYVASGDSFIQQPLVVNGASDLIVEVFGERGRHSRAALGVAWLPDGAAVEVDLVAQVG